MPGGITLADGAVLDVGRYPLPEGLTDGLLNRGQLAVAFGVSENTITKWMSQGLPVESQGTNGQAYEFRLSHCWAWRQDRDDRARAERARGDALAAQAALAFRGPDEDAPEDEHRLTAREVNEWSEALYKRNRVAEQRGDLVRTERVKALLEGLLIQVRTAVYTMPDYAEREFGLTTAQTARMQERCDEVLIEMRNAIARELLDPGQVVALDAAAQTAMDL